MGRNNARNGRTTTVAPIDQDDETSDSIPPTSPSDLEDANKLEDFHAEFEGKSYKVRVEKFNKADATWEIVTRVPYDGWDSYTVCKQYGGGKYRLTLLNERGKYVEGGRQELRIADVTQPAVAAAPEKRDDNPLNNPIVAMMIEQLRSSHLQTTELLKTVLAKPTVEPTAKVPTLPELLETVAKLKSLSPADESFSKKFNEMVTMMDMLERVRGDRGGGGGGDDGGTSWIKEIREGLAAAREAGLIGGRKLPDPAPSGDQPALPATVKMPETASTAGKPVPVAAPTPEPKENPVSRKIIDDLRPHVQILKQKAELKIEIEAGANWLVDELYETVCPIIRNNLVLAKFASDDAIVEQLINRAKDPAQLELVFTELPELVPHREWCSAVVAAAIKILSQPQQPA